jgi:galactokinase/mevalonate kinase-like predicted kinase
MKMKITMPYRLDLAGGWLDQPHVSRHAPGPVITLCIEPTHNFMIRAGMATSTRSHALKMWTKDVPKGDKEVLAKSLFGYENIPGKAYYTGSQDAIGMVYPGLNALEYAGSFWPHEIIHSAEPDVLDFLEEYIRLVPIGPREREFDVSRGSHVTPELVGRLAAAARTTWMAIHTKHAASAGQLLTDSFRAQAAMFPAMVTPAVQKVIDRYSSYAYGWKVTGAGGGGYLLMLVRKHVPGSIRIKVRRS